MQEAKKQGVPKLLEYQGKEQCKGRLEGLEEQAEEEEVQKKQKHEE